MAAWCGMDKTIEVPRRLDNSLSMLIRLAHFGPLLSGVRCWKVGSDVGNGRSPATTARGEPLLVTATNSARWLNVPTG